MYSNNSPISLNTFIEGASCQIKVFKPKGADRKHKTGNLNSFFLSFKLIKTNLKPI